MRGVGNEAALSLERRLEAFQQPVEAGAQSSELVVRAAPLEAFGEIVTFDLGDEPGQLGKRRHRAFGQQSRDRDTDDRQKQAYSDQRQQEDAKEILVGIARLPD